MSEGHGWPSVSSHNSKDKRVELPHPRNFRAGCGCHSGGTEANPVLPWDLQFHTGRAGTLEIPEAVPAPSSPHLSAHLEAASCVPPPDVHILLLCSHAGTPSPCPPGLCALPRRYPKNERFPGIFPPLQARFLRQNSLYPHTPCPLGRIPSWIYFCRFACLGMKGICRGRAAIGRGGLEPPGPAFADQQVTFPGNLGDPGGQGLLLGFHVGSFRMVFH